MPNFDANSVFARLAKKTYVILLKDNSGNLTLLADPGMNRPWSSKNYQIAKFHAEECDGMAATFEEAFKLLLKENPGFEKELVERVERKMQDFTKTKLDQNSLKHGINTNAKRPTDGTILDGSGKPLDPTNN